MVRRDEVGVDRESKDAQPGVEVVLPDRRVPVVGAALQDLGAPDVVDQHVDVAVVVPDPLGETPHLVGVEMVDRDRDAGAAEIRDHLGGLFDRLGAVVLGALRARRAPRADDGRAGFTQRGGDATARATRRARDDGDASLQCVSIR